MSANDVDPQGNFRRITFFDMTDDSFDWKLSDLESCECGAGTFRVRFFFSDNADCSLDDLGPSPAAVSTSLSICG